MLAYSFSTDKTPKLAQVGGMLQHGALVAREYGKPCIAGIENATSILTDGQMVEMDGSSGIIRTL